MSNSRFRSQGFTIVELLIVIVVIAILASVTVVAYNGIQAKAHDAKRRNDLSVLKTAMMRWTIQTGKGPAQTGGGYQQSGEGWAWLDDGVNYIPSIEAVLKADGALSTSGIKDDWYSKPWFGGYMFYTCPAKNSYAFFTALESPTTDDVAAMDSWTNLGCGMTVSSLRSTYGMNYAVIVAIAP